MLKKHYRLTAGILLVVIATVWIIFLDKQRTISAPPEIPASTIVTDTANVMKQKVVEAKADEWRPAATPVPTVDAEPADVPDITEAPIDTPAATPTPMPEPEYTKFDYIIANVQDSMNIRSGAGSNYNVVGKLSVNNYGKIIERGAEWFKIKSGTITGFVSSKYILTDNECIDRMRDLGALKIKITAREVNVRSEDNTNCEIVKTAVSGELYDYYPEYSTDSFYAVKIDDRICYVATSLSEVSIKLKTAA